MCGELWICKRQPGDGGACLFPGGSGGTRGNGRWPQPWVTCEAAIKIKAMSWGVFFFNCHSYSSEILNWLK